MILARLALMAEACEQWNETGSAYRACLMLMTRMQDAVSEATIKLILRWLLIGAMR